MTFILLSGVFLLAGCLNGLTQAQNTRQATPATPTSPPGAPPVIYPETPTPVATPGLVIYGVVRDENGAGVEDVEIYRSYASYAGIVIARTNANGYYQSEFYFIPGDEMVSVWASKHGWTFDPGYHYWRHYYGYEITERDFQVIPRGEK